VPGITRAESNEPASMTTTIETTIGNRRIATSSSVYLLAASAATKREFQAGPPELPRSGSHSHVKRFQL